MAKFLFTTCKWLTLVAMVAFCRNAALAGSGGFSDAIRLALERNEALLAADADIHAARHRENEVRARYRPQASLSMTAGRSELILEQGSRTNLDSLISLSANQTVYDGWRTGFRVDALQAQTRSRQHSRDALKQQTVFNLVLVVLRYQNALKTEENQAESVRIISEQLRGSEIRFKSGVATQTDIAFAQAQLSAAESRLESVRTQRVATAIGFERLVGKPVTAFSFGQIAVPAGLLPDSLAACLAVANATSPEMKRIDALAASAYFDRRVAERAFHPAVSLRASATRSWFDREAAALAFRRDDLRATLNLSWPLYTGGQRRSALAASHARERSISQTRANTQANRERDIELVWNEMRLADRQVVFVREAVSAAGIALEGTIRERDAGIRPAFDVLRAEERLLQAKLDLLDVELRATTTRMRLLLLMGVIGKLADLPG